MRALCISLMIFCLAGCGGDDPAQADVLRGQVTIAHPPPMTAIYASALYATGTASDLPYGRFTLRLTAADGEALAETTVMPGADGAWIVEWLHGYAGDPLPARLIALPVADPDTGVMPDGEYAGVDLLLAGLAHRPEGAYLDLLFPVDGAEMGGDLIQVEGRVSGAAGALRVALIGSDGATLDEQTLDVVNPYRLDDLPWSVTLSPGDFVGSALIQATLDDGDGTGEPLNERVPIILTAAAG